MNKAAFEIYFDEFKETKALSEFSRFYRNRLKFFVTLNLIITVIATCSTIGKWMISNGFGDFLKFIIVLSQLLNITTNILFTKNFKSFISLTNELSSFSIDIENNILNYYSNGVSSGKIIKDLKSLQKKRDDILKKNFPKGMPENGPIAWRIRKKALNETDSYFKRRKYS